MANYERLFGKAVEYQASGRLAAAEAMYRKILGKRPRNIASLNNLGVVLKERGGLEQAASLLRRAVRISPDFPDAHVNLGTVLEQLGQLDEAAGLYRRALELSPGHPDALSNLGDTFRRAGQYVDAIETYQEAVAGNPGNFNALNKLGDALQVEGRLDEAAGSYDRALAIRADDSVRVKQALMLPPVYGSHEELAAVRNRFLNNLDRVAAEPLALEDPLSAFGSLPFYLAYQGFDDAAAQCKIASLFRPHLPEHHDGVAQSVRRGPKKIGFVSSFWHNHSVGSCYLQTARTLAELGLAVVIFYGALRPETTDTAIPDGAEYIRLPRHLAAAREAIAASGLDILVYPDIGMDPFTYFLSFTRLAPVQCVTDGHPITTGVPTIDYFLSCDLLTGEGFAESYSESLVELSWFSGVFARPRLPEVPKPRSALGLPEGCHLYLCPMMLFKMHPDFDEALRGVLDRDPEARVVLFQDRYSNRLHETILARLAGSLGAAEERVVFLPFAPKDDFLTLLMHADVALDTFPFGGGTSTLMVLAMGTPIVTLPNGFERGRTSAGYYRAMGVTELIANDVEHYVDLAVRLGTDADFRAAMKARIADHCSVLYDNTSGAHAMADFFESLDSRQDEPVRISA